MEKKILVSIDFTEINKPMVRIADEWAQRMGTIWSFETEESAVSRLEVWQEGIQFAQQRPWTGAGPNGWFYVAARDWHSAYIEMLAENGVPGLLLWPVGILIRQSCSCRSWPVQCWQPPGLCINASAS